MLDIFMFVPISQPPHHPITPSIDQVKLIAMSNSDGFTPNNSLQQMYETKVVDEDLDVEFSDEELESIAGRIRTASSYYSDVFVGNYQVIAFRNFQQYLGNQHYQIAYIKQQFRRYGIPISDLAAAELSQHLRAVAPRVIKGQRAGFNIDLRTGRVYYNR